MFPNAKQSAIPPTSGDETSNIWIRTLKGALADRSPQSSEIAEQALSACPVDPELLLLGALTATAAGKPERALALLKRFGKRYAATRSVMLLTALALAGQEQHAQALSMLRAYKLDTDFAARTAFVGDEVMTGWLLDRLRTIRALGSSARRATPAKIPATAPSKPAAKKPAEKLARPVPTPPPLPGLPIWQPARCQTQ